MGKNDITIEDIAKISKKASISMLSVNSEIKNNALESMAGALIDNADLIIEANEKDKVLAKSLVNDKQMSESLYKRLLVDKIKINSMSDGLKSIAKLDDPVGKIIKEIELDDNLILSQISTPLGLLGIIFESRPDVVPQVIGLSIKSGNAVIFKGGSEALNTNKAIFDILYKTGIENGLPEGFAALLETRQDVYDMLRLDAYFDLIIPRGSNSFVQMIMENTRIPVLGHADGICSMFVERSADQNMAAELVVDAKTQYPAVCNAIENLLIDEAIYKEFLPKIVNELNKKNVLIKGDSKACKLVESIEKAAEEDWDTEYNDLIISIKIVEDINYAVDFINQHGSGHTDAIITKSKEASDLFKIKVDSSSVMINASTRFADGYRYGKGAEIGISTNKTHARGPVGLEGMVIYKYILCGEGHIVSDYTGKDAKKFTHKII